MSLTENTYEKKLLLDLPPKARDIALDLFSRSSLTDLLSLIFSNRVNSKLLAENQLPEYYWVAILKAATLAKVTYFLPNKQYQKNEILYLLKVSCLCIDYNATPITFIGVLEATKQEDMPELTRWLEQLSGLLIEKK